MIRLLSLLAMSLICCMAYGQNFNCYYGLLHAHTAYSDGSGTPNEAYEMAKQAGLDFFGVSEHNHKAADTYAKDRRDGLSLEANPDLYNGNGTMTLIQNFNDGETDTIEGNSVIEAANLSSDNGFLGFYGQEFSTISKGNHINVFGIEEVLDIESGDFSELLRTIEESDAEIFMQLNHPDVHNDLFYGGSKPKYKGENV